MSKVSAFWQDVESIFISTILGNSVANVKDVPHQYLNETLMRAHL